MPSRKTELSQRAAWLRFLDVQSRARPLRFLVGMRHETPLRYRMHSHAGLELVYHRAGHGRSGLAGQAGFAFAAGSIVIYAPGENHAQVMELPGEDLCIQVERPKGPPALQGWLYLERLDDPFLQEEIESLARGFPHVDARGQALLNLRATTLLMRLLDLYASEPSREDVNKNGEIYVLRAERYIRDHFQQIDAVPGIARAIEISYDYLRHLFRDLRGKSLVGYLNEVRVERARQMLVHTHLPCKQIAAKCGFKDEFYFSAVFRKVTKTRPSTYRQSRR